MNAAGVSGVGSVNANSPKGSPAAMKAMYDIGPMSVLEAAGESSYRNCGTSGVLTELAYPVVFRAQVTVPS